MIKINFHSLLSYNNFSNLKVKSSLLWQLSKTKIAIPPERISCNRTPPPEEFSKMAPSQPKKGLATPKLPQFFEKKSLHIQCLAKKNREISSAQPNLTFQEPVFWAILVERPKKSFGRCQPLSAYLQLSKIPKNFLKRCLRCQKTYFSNSFAILPPPEPISCNRTPLSRMKFANFFE